jgi:hypothetical protein
VVRGALAGAAGTTALNAVTYLDMVIRARPPSSTPEDTVRTDEESVHLSLSAEGPGSAAASHRRSGIGALAGIATGVGAGAAYGMVRARLPRAVPLPVLALAAGLGADAATMAPMAALGVSDPRRWSAASWLSDLVPHLVYGAVTALAFEAMAPPRRR